MARTRARRGKDGRKRAGEVREEEERGGMGKEKIYATEKEVKKNGWRARER